MFTLTKSLPLLSPRRHALSSTCSSSLQHSASEMSNGLTAWTLDYYALKCHCKNGNKGVWGCGLRCYICLLVCCIFYCRSIYTFQQGLVFTCIIMFFLGNSSALFACCIVALLHVLHCFPELGWWCSSDLCDLSVWVKRAKLAKDVSDHNVKSFCRS